MNLRDHIRENNLYESSVDAVIGILQNRKVIVEPEDIIDYVLNTGHRHRVVEGWNVCSSGDFYKEHYSANYYPERALFCALMERVIEDKFTGKDNQKLKSVLRKSYKLEWCDSVYQEELDACKILDKNEESARYIAQEYKKLERLERNARDICKIVKEPYEESLGAMRIRVPNEEELRKGIPKSPAGGSTYYSTLLSILFHFIGSNCENPFSR